MDKLVVNQQKQADLEQHFNAGTKRVSGSFVRKYFLLGEQQRKSFFKNPVRWASLLRKRLRLRPWQAGLKHKEVFIGREQVLLIIALGVAQQSIREFCTELDGKLSKEGAQIPVLLTDTADFSFYSRLGWLVEYVPDMDTPYGKAKLDYLALRYQGAEKLFI